MRWNYFAVEGTFSHGLFSLPGDSGCAVVSLHSVPWYNGSLRLAGIMYGGWTGTSLALPPLWPNDNTVVFPADMALAEVANLVPTVEGAGGAVTLC